MKTGIIIQARMGSTRLPGKVLKKLAGKEVLWHVVERCRQSRLASQVIVATSRAAADDQLWQFCQNNGIAVFRGDENDVLSRFYECAKNFGLDTIVRVTSDCPLIDASIIDGCLELFQGGQGDYVSNCLERIFPRGLDCEVFSFAALREAAEKTKAPYEREHVTPYIIQNKKIMPYVVADGFRGDFRLTLDVAEDYNLLSLIYDRFYQVGQLVDVRQVIKFLKGNPEIAVINSNVEQKASAGDGTNRK